jgi:hypothetical protein
MMSRSRGIRFTGRIRSYLTRAHVSGLQAPGLTPRICYIKGEDEPRVKPGVWRPEIWALYTGTAFSNTVNT